MPMAIGADWRSTFLTRASLSQSNLIFSGTPCFRSVGSKTPT